MTEAVVIAPARRRRVKGWLIVAVVILIPLAMHAVWDQVEATLLARDIAAIARRGEPVNIFSRRQPLPTQEQRRSAGLYAAAADLARWQAERYPSRFADRDIGVLSSASSDAATVTAYLRDAEPALDLLSAATPLDFKGFSYYAPELYTNQSSLEALNAMNCLSADVLSVRGDGEAAATVLIRSIRLQRTTTIPFYRNFSIRRLFGSLRILLNHAPPDAASLQQLQAALEEWPDDDGLATELVQRRAELLGDFWPYPAEGQSWALRAHEPRYRDLGTTLAFVALRPFATRELRTAIRPYEDVLVVARSPWPGKLDAARALQQHYHSDLQRASQWRTLGFLRVPSAIALFSLGDLPWAGANLAMRRTAIATVAVERFRRDHPGELPASLQALVPDYLGAVPEDPFSGKPLILKADAASYTVYSVDLNRLDDGGLLYGAGTGTKDRWRRSGDTTPGDLGIRVSLGAHP